MCIKQSAEDLGRFTKPFLPDRAVRVPGGSFRPPGLSGLPGGVGMRGHHIRGFLDALEFLWQETQHCRSVGEVREFIERMIAILRAFGLACSDPREPGILC